MPDSRSRIDRFLAANTSHSKRDTRFLIAQKRVYIDGQPAREVGQLINQFSKIEYDGELLQEKYPLYYMLNKPQGYLSATKDPVHPTVLDLLPCSDGDLHIAGRLDLHSHGLLLLTNHGEWSSSIASPSKKVAKRYKVRLAQPITDEYVAAFAAGMYFPYEDLVTLPAKLEQLSTHVAIVTLYEGRYHQIKRMFGCFRNQVLDLQRLSIGDIHLDDNLLLGESRALTAKEVALFTS